MSAMEIDPAKVLNFIVSKNNGAEDAPLKMGNVEFWHPIPGLGVCLCYSIPTYQWDIQAVQNDLNKLAEECWDDLCDHLGVKRNK